MPADPGSATIPLAATLGSHPDRRAALTLIVALQAVQLYRWRRQFLGAAAERPSFAPLVVAQEADPFAESAAPEASAPAPGIVEVELACGSRLRIAGAADPAAIRAIMGALRGRRR